MYAKGDRVRDDLGHWYMVVTDLGGESVIVEDDDGTYSMPRSSFREFNRGLSKTVEDRDDE
jgi:hypothetical protein